MTKLLLISAIEYLPSACSGVKYCELFGVVRQRIWLIDFGLIGEESHLIVEKGSITINGVSLTCFDVREDGFKVTIIPYTWEHTTFHKLKVGYIVNLEFDIVGKYIQKMMSKRRS